MHVTCIAQTFIEPCRCVRGLIRVFNNFVRIEIEVLLKQIDGLLLVSEINLIKDVRAQNVPTYRFFKLAMKKGNDLLLPKIQKNGWSPCSFSR